MLRKSTAERSGLIFTFVEDQRVRESQRESERETKSDVCRDPEPQVGVEQSQQSQQARQQQQDGAVQPAVD